MVGTRIVAIVGATGLQGGGLVRAMLGAPGTGFRVRALTRNPDGDAARRLADCGVEVRFADLDEPASVDEAFAGAYAAFCVTNFWEHLSPERETAQATGMAHAARRAGLRHVVWSTLEDVRRFIPLDDPRMPVLLGRYRVPHFDAKGEADEVFTRLGVPTTFLRTSFYWDNLIGFGMGPRPAAGDALELALPLGHDPLPGIAAEDIGHCAHAILERGPAYAGRTVGIAGEHLTGAQMAAALTRAFGRPVRFNDVPLEVYRRLPFRGSEELANMFQFKRECSAAFCGARSVEDTRRLHPGLQTFETWLARNWPRIPLV